MLHYHKLELCQLYCRSIIAGMPLEPEDRYYPHQDILIPCMIYIKNNFIYSFSSVSFLYNSINAATQCASVKSAFTGKPYSF